MSRKAALEQLLRSKKLQADSPPLRGDDLGSRPISTGLSALDALLAGGFPRGLVSEVHGPRSSGRTGLLLSVAARLTREGSLTAWVDPSDVFDPHAASAAGCDLSRLLWIRGRHEKDPLSAALSALGVILGSGVFEFVVFDLADVSPPQLRRLPAGTWVRLARSIEDSKTALVLLGSLHVPHAARGVALALTNDGSSWSGLEGPGRLFRGLRSQVAVGGLVSSPVPLSLQAVD